MYWLACCQGTETIFVAEGTSSGFGQPQALFLAGQNKFCFFGLINAKIIIFSFCCSPLPKKLAIA